MIAFSLKTQQRADEKGFLDCSSQVVFNLLCGSSDYTVLWHPLIV